MSEQATTVAPPVKKRRPPIGILLVVILAVAGYFVWKNYLQPQPVPASIIELSGRIEGDASVISPKVSGRLAEVHFREGDTVKKGAVIAVLDDVQAKAREEQVRASITEAEAKVRLAQDQVAILTDQLRESELSTGQSKNDADARVRQAEAEVAASEAQLAQQEASLKLAAWDRDAYTRLARDGAVSDRQGRQAAITAETQEATVVAARTKVESARAALNVARANLTTPDIRSIQASGIRKQIAQQQSQISSALADEARLRAQLTEVTANRDDLIVVAPFDGTVVTRTAEPGEVIQAGTAILTLLDMSKVYLRGFVPEGQIGKVKVGQAARLFLDSNAKQPLDAEVQRIDPQATFTPENTYFRDDRVKQVVGVKLLVKSGIGFAKPGMPADGEILVSGDTWPPVQRTK
jgi:HlyD family secretion protein